MDKNKFVLLHIVESLKFGGMENGIVNTINLIDRRYYQPVVCCLKESGQLEERIEDKTIPIISLNKKDGLRFTLFFKLIRVMLRHKVDIVHAHGWGTLLYAFIAAKIAGVPVIINGEHGTFHLSQKRRQMAYRFIISFCDKVLPVSESLRRQLINKLNIDQGKVITIPNGVNSNKFCNGSSLAFNRDKLGLNDKLVIGSVGRLIPVKNYPLLIRSVAVLKKQFPKIRCLLIGDGKCRTELENLSKELNTEKEIVFLGERGDVEKFIPLMDIFILTSDSEGMSNTILEAMACGKPVIATDVGGCGELVSNNYNGILVEKGDLDGLVTSVKELLLEAEKRDLFGKNSRNIIKESYTLEKMTKQYEYIYEKCLVNKGLWQN